MRWSILIDVAILGTAWWFGSWTWPQLLVVGYLLFWCWSLNRSLHRVAEMTDSKLDATAEQVDYHQRELEKLPGTMAHVMAAKTPAAP